MIVENVNDEHPYASFVRRIRDAIFNPVWFSQIVHVYREANVMAMLCSFVLIG